MTLHIHDNVYPLPTRWEPTAGLNHYHDDSLFGEGPDDDVFDMVTEKDSKAARAKVLMNGLTELIVFGIRLKEAGLHGSYDLVRGVTVQLQRQYAEFIDDEVQPE